MLEVKSIESSYGTSQVLFGMTLEVDAGEVVTLMGRNGMGKTTTIRSIMGLMQPHAGSISFEGQRISSTEMTQVFVRWADLFPIITIEDGHDQNNIPAKP